MRLPSPNRSLHCTVITLRALRSYLAKALTTLMLFWSSGERTSPSVPHLNNSDSIIFCWRTELSFKLNHIVPHPVCGNPFSMYLLSSTASKNGGMPMGGRCGHPLMTESILWYWWLDRQLFNRVFVYISLKSTSVLKGRRKLAFPSLHSVTFYPCSTPCSLHSPCHRSQWNYGLNLSQPERATYSITSARPIIQVGLLLLWTTRQVLGFH